MVTPYETFLDGVRATHGEEAEPWLAHVDHLIAELSGRWELETGEPRRGDADGYVVDAIRGRRQRVVLRIAYPDGWFHQQTTALSVWDGVAAVELIDHDPRGAQLLERPEPGAPLRAEPEPVRALDIAAEVAKKLWVPDPGGIDAVETEVTAWAASMDDRNESLGEPIEEELIEEARSALVLRSAEQRERSLLHGDLHLGNIVSAKNGRWLAVDPRPLVGEREFDAAALLTDDGPAIAARGPAGRLRLRRRLDQLVPALECDPERLRDWALAITVDYALWAYEAGDREAGEAGVTVAKMLQGLIPTGG
jgi:streptomycin 6-kinase